MNTEEEKFIVDSGASQHINNNAQSFFELKEIDPETVSLADGGIICTKKQRSLSIDLHLKASGAKHRIRLLNGDVLWIPETGVSILPCTQRDKVVIFTKFSIRKYQLIDGNEESSINGEAFVRHDGILFVLNGTENKDYKNYLCSTSDDMKKNMFSIIFHERCGHQETAVTNNIRKYHFDCVTLPSSTSSLYSGVFVGAKQTKSPSTGNLLKIDEEHIVHSGLTGPL